MQAAVSESDKTMHLQTIAINAASLMLALLTGAVPAGETVRQQIDHDGSSRSYTVYIPDSLQSPAPVVLNLHGTRGTSSGQAAVSRMNEVADDEGFLVVYPQATMSTPNGVRWNQLQLPDQINDVSFIGSVLDLVQRDFNADIARIYATGFSNGGSMTHVLANAYPDRLAAVAPVAGSIAIRDSAGRTGPIDPVTSPTTSRPMPILFVHGTDDFLVPFGSGRSPLTGDLYPAVEVVVSAWLANNNCQTETTITEFEDLVTTDGSTVELQNFPGCDEYLTTTGAVQAEVRLFKIIGGNHQWPGGASPSPLNNPRLQPRNDDMNASREIWDFFSGHQVPTPNAADFDQDGMLTVADVDLLAGEVNSFNHNLSFDLNSDGFVNQEDIRIWIAELEGTWFGDANLDGEFNSSDLIEVFKVGAYEQLVDASWAGGDWTGDLRFDSGDLIAAFQDGGYEQGSRAAVKNAPEPSISSLLFVAVIVAGLATTRQRRLCCANS